jgi:chromosome segregation ATPase
MLVLSAALLWMLFGVSSAARTEAALQSRARSSTQALRSDLRVWLQRGGASRLEAAEKVGEQSIDKLNDSNSQEDDTNEKIIEALLVKQKRLEGENRGLRKQLQAMKSSGSTSSGASQELLAQLEVEKNQSVMLQAQVSAKDQEIRTLKQSLNKAKKALLQSVDGETSDSGAAKETQSQALTDAHAENTKLRAKLREVEGRRQALQASVSHLQGALNMSLIAVSEAEHQLSKDASEAKDPSLTAAKKEIQQLRSENQKLKTAGHTLMEKFDQLRARR